MDGEEKFGLFLIETMIVTIMLSLIYGIILVANSTLRKEFLFGPFVLVYLLILLGLIASSFGIFEK